MIVRSSGETYEGGRRLVLYEVDEAGKCVPTLQKSMFDQDIETFYEQRAKELARLEREVLEGKISPLALYMGLYRLTADDIAARARVRKSLVRRHVTAEGFRSARVDTLERYAAIFDATVADFFQLTHISDGLEVEVERAEGGSVQRVTVTLSDS